MSEEIRLGPLVSAIECDHGYNVVFHNGKFMGTLEKDVDGFYKYWPVQQAGYWDAPPLRAIADLLDHVNAEWEEDIHMYFDSHRN